MFLVKEVLVDEGENVVEPEKGMNYWYYVLGGFVVLVLIWFLLWRKKR